MAEPVGHCRFWMQTQSQTQLKSWRTVVITGKVPVTPLSSRRPLMTNLSSFASSRLCVKSESVTQRRKVAKKTRSMEARLFGRVPVKANELEKMPHDRSFFLCDFASSREMKMCHAKTLRKRGLCKASSLAQSPLKTTELEEMPHDRSFFLCVFASLREMKMCHAKAQRC
jgi:hypothetical protein